jgi:5-methylthioadenosine/S-adenosylhomocysteine deaminase
MVMRRSGKTPAQLLESVGLLDSRLVAAHCQFMEESDIARVSRAGITVAHNPKGNATGGTMAPAPALRAAGVRIALGTDNMHANMTEVMRWALAIARIHEGHVADDWQPANALAMAMSPGAATLVQSRGLNLPSLASLP